MNWLFAIAGGLCFFAFLAWVRSNVVIGLHIPEPTSTKCKNSEDQKHDFTDWSIRGDGFDQHDYRRCRKCDTVETRDVELYVGVRAKQKGDQYV